MNEFINGIIGHSKILCKMLGHGNLIRHRHENGELGFRCENCSTIVPNTLNSIGTEYKDYNLRIPTEPNYQAAKAKVV